MGCGGSTPQDVEEQDSQLAALEELKRQRMEEEASLKAEEDAALSAEKLKEEAKRKAMEEVEAARLKKEQEAAEEAVRVKAEEEALRIKAEQEAAEEAARVKAEEEVREKQEREEAAIREQIMSEIVSDLVTDAEQKVSHELAEYVLADLLQEAEDRTRVETVQETLQDLCVGVQERLAQEEEDLRLAEIARAAAEAERSRDEAETVKMGWLSKQGHVVKNWKKRWFVLEKGVLRYFVKPMGQVPYGEGLKGEMILENYVVIAREGRSFELQTYEDQTGVDQQRKKPGLIRRLSMGRSNSVAKIKCESTLINAENEDDAKQWISRLNAHIEHFYKTDYEKSEAVQKEFMRGTLEVKGLLWNQRWFSLRLNKLGEYRLHAHIVKL